MDLVCASKAKTNFIISARHIAFGIAGALFFAVPDYFGRRNPLLITWFISLVAEFVVIFIPSYEARLVGNIVGGACALKQSVTFVWIFELLPEKRKTMASVSMSCFNTATIAVVCLYFWAITKNWMPLFLGMSVLNTVAFIFSAFFMPESPKWLIEKGRVEEAI